MFVKNVNSIKRRTISVGEDLKIYLIRNGYSPISKKDNKWIYLHNESVLNLIKNFKGSDS